MISPTRAMIRLQVTIPGESLRKKLATLVPRTKSTPSKRLANNTRATELPLVDTSHSDVGVALPPPFPKTMGRKNTPQMTRAPPSRLRTAPKRADRPGECIATLSFWLLRPAYSFGSPKRELFMRLPWLGSRASIRKIWEQEQMSSVPSLQREAQHEEGCGILQLRAEIN